MTNEKQTIAKKNWSCKLNDEITKRRICDENYQ